MFHNYNLSVLNFSLSKKRILSLIINLTVLLPVTFLFVSGQKKVKSSYLSYYYHYVVSEYYEFYEFHTQKKNY